MSNALLLSSLSGDPLVVRRALSCLSLETLALGFSGHLRLVRNLFSLSDASGLRSSSRSSSHRGGLVSNALLLSSLGGDTLLERRTLSFSTSTLGFCPPNVFVHKFDGRFRLACRRFEGGTSLIRRLNISGITLALNLSIGARNLKRFRVGHECSPHS